MTIGDQQNEPKTKVNKLTVQGRKHQSQPQTALNGLKHNHKHNTPRTQANKPNLEMSKLGLEGTLYCNAQLTQEVHLESPCPQTKPHKTPMIGLLLSSPEPGNPKST